MSVKTPATGIGGVGRRRDLVATLDEALRRRSEAAFGQSGTGRDRGVTGLRGLGVGLCGELCLGERRGPQPGARVMALGAGLRDKQGNEVQRVEGVGARRGPDALVLGAGHRASVVCHALTTPITPR